MAKEVTTWLQLVSYVFLSSLPFFGKEGVDFALFSVGQANLLIAGKWSRLCLSGIFSSFHLWCVLWYKEKGGLLLISHYV